MSQSNSLAQQLADLGGLEPDLAATVVVIGAALIKLIRGNADATVREEALMTIAEETKAALDRNKFPGQDV